VVGISIFEKLKGRYEFEGVLSQGGMGVIYRALDLRLKRPVAVKTIRDAPDEISLKLFERECEVLARLSHPNIVEIFDVGEFSEPDDSGGITKKPYFVMPLLNGRNLEEILRRAVGPLPVSRSVEIISQACRGLQAAHEQGLVHRDLKPSNIFVLDDDSVKIIDFGVAHMMFGTTTGGRTGTVYYMSPEQIKMGALTPKSDQFAIGVVTYQLLTGRRPFDGATERDVARSALHDVPALASTLNREVSETLSQVTAKALAKRPEKRWDNVREFGLSLQKAFHGQAVPAFHASRSRQRLEAAARAFEGGDASIAWEIVRDLEDEGHADPAIPAMRKRIGESNRLAELQTLLGSAQRRFERGEYALALEKVMHALEIDSEHVQAHAMRYSIEQKLVEQKVAAWSKVAAEHLEAGALSSARDAARLIIDAGDPGGRGSQVLAEIDRREEEQRKLVEAREALYGQALAAWQGRNPGAALTRLERLRELAPSDENHHSELYQRVHEEVRRLDRAYDEARTELRRNVFDRALAICQEELIRYPDHPIFQALLADIVDAQGVHFSDSKPTNAGVAPLPAAETSRRNVEPVSVQQAVRLPRDASRPSATDPSRSSKHVTAAGAVVWLHETAHWLMTHIAAPFRRSPPRQRGVASARSETAGQRQHSTQSALAMVWRLGIGGLPSPSARAVIGGLCLLTLLTGCVLLFSVVRQPRQAAATVAPLSLVTLPVRVTPQGAAIRIDQQDRGAGDVSVDLAPGTHRIEASLAGYYTQERLVRIEGRAVAPVNLVLDREIEFSVYTDASDASLLFDGTQAAPAKEGRFEVPGVRPGKHTAVVSLATAGEARFEFETESSGEIDGGEILSEHLLGALAKSNGEEVILFATEAGARLSLDHSRPEAAVKAGLILPGVSAGDHSVTIASGAEHAAFPLQAHGVPFVVAFVHATQPTGGIAVSADEEGASIFLDGRKLGTVTGKGKTHLLGIPSGTHTISVSKDGFESSPLRKLVIATGETVEVPFDLRRLPPPSGRLEIFGAMAGTELLLEQNKIGSIQEDGALAVPVSPGTYTLHLRHEGYLPKSLPVHVESGQTLRISGAELRMTPDGKPATIRLSVVPAIAKVLFGRPGEAPLPVDPRNPISLSEGTWAFTAQASGYQTSSVLVTVADGEQRALEIKLVRTEKPKEASSIDPLSGWENPELWIPENGSFVRQGGGFALFGRRPIAGTITFTAALRKGRRMQWVLLFADKDYILCELDRKYLTRYEFRDGKRSKLAQVPLEVDISEPVTIQILIQSDSLRQLYKSSEHGKWQEVDVWNQSARNLADARFGFLLPGKDTLVLTKFTYAP